jgi:anti-anti-sigma regulatory factor
MLKIEFESNGAGRHIRLIGRVRADNIAELSSQIVADDERTTLDLREVTIVDLAAVRFLLSCEKKGLELMNCPLYIREWIAREQNTPGK